MVFKKKLSNQVLSNPIIPPLKTRPLDTEEKERMEASYKVSYLTEEERQEIIAKYGPPTAPYGSYRSLVIPTKKKKGGDAA